MTIDTAAHRPVPDVIVVVMDCARADDFYREAGPDGGMPFCRRLRNECIEYPRALSPSSWTVPSHVSLFTGLYPWEHGVHGKGAQSLDPSVPRLATALRQRGYSAFSLSANANISSDRGLVEDFDRAGWGGWDESFLRFRPPVYPPFTYPADPDHHPTRRSSHNRLVPFLRKRIMPEVRRLPFFWAGSEMVVKVRDRDSAAIRLTAPWIEPTLDRWLDAQRVDRPVYCFFNFLDCHEPYPPRWGSFPGIADWFQYSAIPQDRKRWLEGSWKPTPSEFTRLRELYRRGLRSLDQRLERIVRILQEHGRWNDSLFILTSDHGQAFGEGDSLHHMFSVHDAVLRVPLWVRPPGGRPPVRSAAGWASLIDVPATILGLSEGERMPTDNAVPLPSLVDSPRPSPALAMSEGLLWDRWKDLPAYRRERLDRVEVAAYDGDWKVVVDARQGTVRAFDLHRAGGETVDVWKEHGNDLGHLASAARAAGQRLLAAKVETVSAEVDARLAAWGY